MRKLGLVFLLALALTAGWAQMPTRSQAPVVPSTQAQISIAGTVAAATEIIPLTAGQRIYVTGINLIPLATSVVTFTSGTGTNCGTNTTSVTGAMTFAAGQTLNYGTGNGAVLVATVSHALCITIATAVAPGSLAYAKF